MSTSTQFRFTGDELKIVAMVTVLLFVGLLGTDIHLSSLPEIMSVMQVSRATLQASISIFLFGTGVGALVYGPLSDKYGRKPVILIGIAVAIAGNLWAVYAAKASVFLAARFVQGIGSGVCLALSRVVLSDIVQGPRYAIASSYITLFTGLSFVLGPLLGSLVQAWFGWRANFVLMALLLAVIFLAYGRSRETNIHKDPSISVAGVFASYAVVLGDATFLATTVMAGIGMTCFVLYTSSSPFVLQQRFGFSATDYGWATALVGSGLIISRLAFPWLVRTLGMHATMAVGFVITLLCGAALLIVAQLGLMSAWVFLACVAGISFSYSFIVLCASALAINRFPTRRGAAGALYCCSQMGLAFGVNSLVSAAGNDVVALLGVSYVMLPVLGLGLCLRMRTASA